jgi:hypothetical protein
MDDTGTCARWERSSRIGKKSISATETGARTIRHALEQLFLKGSVRKAGDEFIVEADIEGASARELNRTFLSALRKGRRERRSVRMDCLTTAPSKVFRLCPEEDNQQNLQSRN